MVNAGMTCTGWLLVTAGGSSVFHSVGWLPMLWDVKGLVLEKSPSKALWFATFLARSGHFKSHVVKSEFVTELAQQRFPWFRDPKWSCLYVILSDGFTQPTQTLWIGTSVKWFGCIHTTCTEHPGRMCANYISLYCSYFIHSFRKTVKMKNTV